MYGTLTCINSLVVGEYAVSEYTPLLLPQSGEFGALLEEVASVLIALLLVDGRAGDQLGGGCGGRSTHAVSLQSCDESREAWQRVPPFLITCES